ncbi:MAG: metallophosphoesterase [Verrucomicrobiales bacterium]|nr:metallophosphoesterase [Verrucomicrobiales bacterium]
MPSTFTKYLLLPLLTGFLNLTSLQAVEPFTIVVLPDTQGYCDTRHKQRTWKDDNLQRYFFKQTEWTAANQKRLNISFLVHEGDIVQTDYPEEWAIAKKAMSKLDGKVPYCMCLGNHDIGYKKTDKNEHSYTTAVNRETHFNEFFPREKYAKRSEFGGTFDEKRHDNSWYHFKSAGLKFMIIALECKPRDAVLDWANQVVKKHPDHRVIVLTHSYLNGNKTRTSKGMKVKGNLGEQMWQKFVKKHQNIFMVLCGHVGGEAMLTSTGDHGNQVHQLLSNYQALNHGGESWLRYMTFQPEANKIEVFTYNPALGKFDEKPSSRFDLDYPMLSKP